MTSYEGFLTRLHTLETITDQKFPANENEERHRLLRLAIKSAIISLQAGIDGDEDVLSPSQLSHWLEVKMKDIHESFDGPVQEEQAPAPRKRKSAPIVELAPGKRQKRRTTEEQDVAIALLALARPPAIVFKQDTMANRRIPRCRETYTDFPAVDRFEDPKDAFLAGVQYTLQNFASAEPDAPAFDRIEFHNHVRARLGTKTAVEMEVGRGHDEIGADEDVEATRAGVQLVEMANTGRVGAVRDVGQSASQANGKGFWHVI
ncbi:hypothetical protein PTMSG1_05354 [Pyrenophora teres f. maculata]|nr:hypothetical protein PTMSG1_05354 [Pyrenophora teres f. maculata]